MARHPMPDVIVLLPGIMGSVLRRGNKDVWAASGSAGIQALLSAGDSIRDLRFDGSNDDDVPDDGVTAHRLMPFAHLIPGFWKIDGYSETTNFLMSRFEITAGQNYFEFPYDWRLSIRVTGARLQEATHRWLKDWRASSGNADARLILVGHSMGGLVARHFIEVLDGWRDTRALVTFGTPYRGSLNALNTLVHGEKKVFGLADFSGFVRSLPSVYQLLPIYPCYDPGTGDLQRVAEATGIPNVSQARASHALAVHHEIRDKVKEHLDNEEYVKRGYEIFPVSGINQPTRQSARLDGGKIVFANTYHGKDGRGDGTVPRASAIPLELDNDPRAMYPGARHASLQYTDSVLTHLEGLITAMYLDFGSFQVLEDPRGQLSLDVDDAYSASEPVTVRLQSSTPGLTLTVRVDRAESDEVITQAVGPVDESWTEVDLGPLASGMYRISATAPFGVQPVMDIFAVLDGQP